MKQYKLDYKELKRAIVKSCAKSTSSDTSFSIDYEKLKELVKDIGLIPVQMKVNSDFIIPSNVLLISEYMKFEKLEWISEEKSLLPLLFVESDCIDTEINTEDVKTITKLIATKPCYKALVIGYLSSDPDRFNKLNYAIECRANPIVLRREENK